MRQLLVLAPVFVLACDSESTGGSSSVPANQIHESFADAYCEFLTNCTFAGDLSTYATLVAASDRAACRAFFTRLADTGLNVEARVQSGAITYDSKAFGECINALETSCDLDGFAGCEGAFKGKVAPDGTCESDLDCAGDARCESSSSSGAMCVASVCKARVARGEACDFDGDCSQSAGPTACTDASNLCVPVTSEAGIAVGARCDDAYNANDVTRRSCAAGLACAHADDGSQAFCRQPLAKGVACTDSDIPCAKGLVCLQTSSGGESCEPLTVVRTVGGDCNINPLVGPLVVCSLIDQLGCDNGKCKKWGDGAVGSYCDVTYETNWSCDRGNYCTSAQTCAVQKAAGVACERSNECLDGYCDNFGDQTGSCVSTVCT